MGPRGLGGGQTPRQGARLAVRGQGGPEGPARALPHIPSGPSLSPSARSWPAKTAGSWLSATGGCQRRGSGLRDLAGVVPCSPASRSRKQTLKSPPRSPMPVQELRAPHCGLCARLKRPEWNPQVLVSC